VAWKNPRYSDSLMLASLRRLEPPRLVVDKNHTLLQQQGMIGSMLQMLGPEYQPDEEWWIGCIGADSSSWEAGALK